MCSSGRRHGRASAWLDMEETASAPSAYYVYVYVVISLLAYM